MQLSRLGTSTPTETLTVIGSTIRSDGSPRLFSVDVPALNCNFNGTGDMFAALMVARLREAVFEADATPQLRATRSWVSPDDIASTDLPLAKATEKVLSSMHYVLERTMEARTAELAAAAAAEEVDTEGTDEQKQFRKHLRETKAGEVRLIRNVHALRNPQVIFRAREWQSS